MKKLLKNSWINLMQDALLAHFQKYTPHWPSTSWFYLHLSAKFSCTHSLFPELSRRPHTPLQKKCTSGTSAPQSWCQTCPRELTSGEDMDCRTWRARFYFYRISSSSCPYEWFPALQTPRCSQNCRAPKLSDTFGDASSVCPCVPWTHLEKLKS